MYNTCECVYPVTVLTSKLQTKWKKLLRKFNESLSIFLFCLYFMLFIFLLLYFHTYTVHFCFTCVLIIFTTCGGSHFRSNEMALQKNGKKDLKSFYSFITVEKKCNTRSILWKSYLNMFNVHTRMCSFKCGKGHF